MENTKKDTFSRQDGNPGSAVNTDKAGLLAYKKRKQRENEINTIKEEISEIKSLLTKLLENNK